MFRKRLVAIAVTIFTVGIFFGIFMRSFDTQVYRGIFMLLAVLSVAGFIVFKKKEDKKSFKRITAAAFAVAAFAFGVLRVSLQNIIVAPNEIYDNAEDVAIFEVTDINEYSLDAKIISSEAGVPEGESVRLYISDIAKELIIGDKIKCEVKYKYKDTLSLRANGAVLSASGNILEHTEGEGLFYTIRKSVFNNSKILYGDFKFAQEISRGVTIGDRSDIDSYVFSVYQSSGLSHILAISGLHISIITMALHSLLIRLSVDTRISGIVASIVAVLYCGLVGFTPGAVRATVMLVIMMSLRLFLKGVDSFTSLFYSLLLILIVEPYAICSAGLQLSFLCTIGILLIQPFFRIVATKFKYRRGIRSKFGRFLGNISNAVICSVMISFVAAVFSFPVTLYSFDVFSYVSPAVNIFAVPLFTLAIELALVSYLVAPIWSGIGVIFAYPAGLIFDFVSEIAGFIYDKDIGVVSVHSYVMIFPLIIAVLLIIALIFFPNKSRFKYFGIFSGAFCVSLIICGVILDNTTSAKIFIEYGSDDNEYIYLAEADNNIYVNIDGYNCYTDVIYESGFTSLDGYVDFEYDNYTYENINFITGKTPVGTLYLAKPKTATDMQSLSKIKELAKNRNCDIILFSEKFAANITQKSNLTIFNQTKDLSDSLLICVDVEHISLRILGEGYKNAVNCDIAVITDGYEGGFNSVISPNIYVQNGYLESQDIFVNTFDNFSNAIRVEIDPEESECEIYEP